jgi:Cu2+-exporting ATPase
MDHSHHHQHHGQVMQHNQSGHSGRVDSESGYNKHAGHHTSDFLKRFWICVAITIPVLMLSPMIQHWTGMVFSFKNHKYLLLALSSIIFFYGGIPFLRGMISEIRQNAVGMMTLVALAISVSYVYSVATVMGFAGMDFFGSSQRLSILCC